MPEGPAVDSFRYALNWELIKLYVTIIFGQFVIAFSQNFGIIGIPIFLCGLVLVFGGIVGVLHRVVSDTTLVGQ